MQTFYHDITRMSHDILCSARLQQVPSVNCHVDISLERFCHSKSCNRLQKKLFIVSMWDEAVQRYNVPNFFHCDCVVVFTL